LKTDISIIAVGTPSTKGGHLNLDYIFNVAKNIAISLKFKETFHYVVIRSTVLPGTGDNIAEIIEEVSGKKRNEHFAIISNPEFLREGTAVSDYYNPPLTLIGSDNITAAKIIGDLYSELPGKIVYSKLKTAEIMKYVNNTFHALKISFANEVGNICDSLGIDSHDVMDIFIQDHQLNISPYYFKPGFAYGGSCLPKDLGGFQALARNNFIDCPVIDNIDKSNTRQIERAINILSEYSQKKLGFLGLSFKAGTDDLRNSPAVEVIERMMGKGAEISIYDKNVELAKLTGTNKDYIENKLPHLSKLMVANISEVIESSEVIVINNKDLDFVRALESVEDKPIIDFVRIDEKIRLKPLYKGINW
jgi:GDP-mannose 6-dehydrogenase